MTDPAEPALPIRNELDADLRPEPEASSLEGSLASTTGVRDALDALEVRPVAVLDLTMP